jgi:manganese-dependent inorganic pyrophosphatase
MGPVLVFGHRNPDNDSICSAIAYAHLKNLTDPANVYVPARLGPVPPESEWVLRHFGVAEPIRVDHVRTRVSDVMTTDLVTVGPHDTLHAVGVLLTERGIRALPVVEDGEVRGLVTVQALAARYVEDLSVTGFAERPVSVDQVAEALGGSVVAGDGTAQLGGRVVIGAMEPATIAALIEPGDTLIVGDRRRTQPLAIEAGLSCLIVTDGHEPTSAVLDLAARHGCAIVVTPKDAYAAARSIELSHEVAEVMETDILTVEPDSLLSEAAEDLFGSPQREAPVVDAESRLVGLLTRTNVARAGRRRVILVDHNEIAQSADGVDEATVIEIVDHHRIGDVQTAGPISFLASPVGATATIVATRFRDLAVDPPQAMAGLMLAAILTDTVLLKSPTTTDTDREMVEWLSELLDLDPADYAMDIFRARSSAAEFSVERTVAADLKEYRLAGCTIGIAQVETVDLDEVLAHREQLATHMESLVTLRGYDLLLLMVTDVVREGSELLVAGKRRLAERAFGVSFESGSAYLEGVMSRKKQVAPRFTDSMAR